MSSSHHDVDGLCGALLGVGTVVVGLRFLARKMQKGQFAADDWLMIPTYILFIGFLASCLYATHHRVMGYSTPEFVKQHPSPELMSQVFIAVDVFASAFFGCVKASALCFFQRVFCPPGKRDTFQILIWVMLLITGMWTILFILLPIFQCGPRIAASWDTPPKVRAELCKSATGIVESMSVSDTVLDFIILILPIHKIWNLESSLRRRLGVLFVFSTAAVALAASLAKTIILYRIYDYEISGDPLVESTRSYFMWVLEAGFAIIAVNLPSLVWFRQAKGPEKILASIRSFLTIRSHSSASSHLAGETKAGSYTSGPSRSGSISHPIVHGDHSQQGGPLPRPPVGIVVTSEVKHEYETV